MLDMLRASGFTSGGSEPERALAITFVSVEGLSCMNMLLLLDWLANTCGYLRTVSCAMMLLDRPTGELYIWLCVFIVER